VLIDSFYKRFSDLKLRAPNVRKAQEVELESEREKSNNIPTISYQLTKYQNLLQTKKALVKFQNKEDPKSLLVNQSLNKVIISLVKICLKSSRKALFYLSNRIKQTQKSTNLSTL